MLGVKELREKLGQALTNVNLAIDRHPITKKELMLDMTTKFTSHHKITITKAHIAKGTRYSEGTVCLAWDKKTSSRNG